MLARGLMMLALWLGLAGAAQAGMVLTSPGMTEGAALPVSGSAANCGGGASISPALAWTGVPPGVGSFAIVLYDPDAPGGPGFVHWVLYGIPGNVTSIPEGYGDGVKGANGGGKMAFQGYCPPVGNTPHHYTFTLYATDLGPSALEPGLTRDALLAALHGHVKAATSFVGLYGR